MSELAEQASDIGIVFSGAAGFALARANAATQEN